MRKIMMLLIVSLFSLGCVVNEGQLILLEPTATLPIVTENIADMSIAVPFETIFKDSDGFTTYETMELFVIADQMQAETTDTQLFSGNPDHHFFDSLEVDYEQELIIVAYFGRKPSGGFEIAIEEINKTEKQVYVTMTTIEPTAGSASVTYPIHIVKVKKANLPLNNLVTFHLVEQNQILLTRAFTISH